MFLVGVALVRIVLRVVVVLVGEVAAIVMVVVVRALFWLSWKGLLFL